MATVKLKDLIGKKVEIKTFDVERKTQFWNFDNVNAQVRFLDRPDFIFVDYKTPLPPPKEEKSEYLTSVYKSIRRLSDKYVFKTKFSFTDEEIKANEKLWKEEMFQFKTCDYSKFNEAEDKKDFMEEILGLWFEPPVDPTHEKLDIDLSAMSVAMMDDDQIDLFVDETIKKANEQPYASLLRSARTNFYNDVHRDNHLDSEMFKFKQMFSLSDQVEDPVGTMLMPASRIAVTNFKYLVERPGE